MNQSKFITKQLIATKPKKTKPDIKQTTITRHTYNLSTYVRILEYI